MSGAIFLVLRILLAGLLFLFLGWALRLIWLGLKDQAGQSKRAQIPGLTLAPILAESSDPFHFTQAVVLVGRDPACDCLIADQTISGQHARLRYELTQWWVEDLHSTNGTFLNQQAITSPVVLASGDELCFGQLAFRVTFEGG